MYFQTHFKRLYRNLCLLLVPVLLLFWCLVKTDVVEETVFGSVGRTVKLPVLMYHSVCINKRVNSEYVLTPEKFETDMAYLKKAGYQAVLPSEIIDFLNGNGTLPSKPVLITFDDGFYNNYAVCLPILEAYGFKALINVVGAYTEQYTKNPDENEAYAHLSCRNISRLSDSGSIEIGAHTFNMHSLKGRNGCKINKNEDTEAYKQLFLSDTLQLNAYLFMHCNLLPTVFAYPYGAVCTPAGEVLENAGFRMLLTCEEKINTLTFSGGTPVVLGRINRYASLSTEVFMSKYGIK